MASQKKVVITYCVPRYLRHISGLFCSHKRKTSFLNFFLKQYNILQKLLFQSKWMHNFNKYEVCKVFHEILWVAIKWSFFSWKGYFLPFEMRYSFLCCCKYLLRYIFFLFEQSKFHQFWTTGESELSSLITSLWTATLCPQNKSGRERFLCWPTHIIWKGHISLMWKLGAKRSWWQILSCKLAFNEFVMFFAMVD